MIQCVSKRYDGNRSYLEYSDGEHTFNNGADEYKFYINIDGIRTISRKLRILK